MRRAYCLLLVGLVGLGAVFVCARWASQVNWRKVWDTLDGGSYSIHNTMAAYEFDPKVVSTTLPSGDFLTPVPLYSPTPVSVTQTAPIRMNDDVLYGMANRLLATASVEPKLVVVSFQIPCANAEVGPQLVTFGYVRLVDETLSFPYLREDVNINTEWGKILYTSGWENFLSPSADEPVVDYPNLPIRIYEALQIAEDSGGRDFRDSVDNACEIRGGIGAYRETGKWKVGYVILDEEKNPEWVLEFEIDAMGGEVRLLERQ